METKNKILIILVIVIALIIGGFIFNSKVVPIKYLIKAPANFDECAEAKGKIMESFPLKCSFWGNTFVKEEKKNGSNNQFCIQVITPAKNPETGECKEFPTPCDVPQGWEKADTCPNY